MCSGSSPCYPSAVRACFTGRDEIHEIDIDPPETHSLSHPHAVGRACCCSSLCTTTTNVCHRSLEPRASLDVYVVIPCDSRDSSRLHRASRVRREFRGPLSSNKKTPSNLYFTHQKLAIDSLSLVCALSCSLFPSFSLSPPFFPPRISTFRFDRKCPPQGYPSLNFLPAPTFPTLKASTFHF